MSNLKADHPIGIFDSGVGGLTVAKTVVDNLPNESMIYFGDTKHLPYGDKSVQAIQSYVREIADFLLERKVKLILIACNSASAAAYEMLQDYIGTRALLVNVVDPVVRFICENYAGKCVGLIGTKLTIQSGIYSKKISELACQIDLRAQATPLLVPIIEEGLFEHELIDVALTEYLSNPMLQGIDALVLGCTHYPVIKKNIENFYQGRVKIIDAGKIVAEEVKAMLIAQNLTSSISPNRQFYVSDYTEGFVKGARLFFDEEVVPFTN